LELEHEREKEGSRQMDGQKERRRGGMGTVEERLLAELTLTA